ncbi:hypothetical protein Pcinc_039051, partial [Petrolisthes cinctipes]
NRPGVLSVSDAQKGPAKEGVVGTLPRGGKGRPHMCVQKRNPSSQTEEVQNILVVERLTRDYHNTTLTCAATQHKTGGPVTTRVVVKMLLLPTSVLVRSEGAVREGSQAVLGCVSRGSRPAAHLSWKLNGKPLPRKLQEIIIDPRRIGEGDKRGIEKKEEEKEEEEEEEKEEVEIKEKRWSV